MREPLTERLARVKELLRTVRHVPLATVNTDGSPHNSPVFAAFDQQLNLYWGSSPQARHSQNIARAGQVFVVVFDSMQQGGGLYIQASARQLQDDELATGLNVFNTKRQATLRESIPLRYFTSTGPQRLYLAQPLKLWVNLANRDKTGNILEDKRYPIKIDDLA